MAHWKDRHRVGTSDLSGRPLPRPHAEDEGGVPVSGRQLIQSAQILQEARTRRVQKAQLRRDPAGTRDPQRLRAQQAQRGEEEPGRLEGGDRTRRSAAVPGSWRSIKLNPSLNMALILKNCPKLLLLILLLLQENITA